MISESVNKQEYNQSKYNYYKEVLRFIIVLVVLSDIMYWVSDCQIFGRISYETIIPRISPAIPMVVYLAIEKKTNNYKIMIPLAYLVIHSVMWSTIWAIVYLPDKQYANEGFIVMHLMFLAVGLVAPLWYSRIFHSLLMIDIIASYPINHYEDFAFMISLGLPCLIAIELLLIIIDRAYSDKYKLNMQLEWVSVHDQLTELYNRNIFNIDSRLKNNELTTDVATLLIIDIDHFKYINDSYGHFEGDKVLKKLAKMLSSIQNENDFVIRWGGEEFVIILYDVDIHKGQKTAERIRFSVDTSNDFSTHVTISIGVSEYKGGNILDTIKQADKALYFAKQSGRNKVVVYENMAYFSSFEDK